MKIFIGPLGVEKIPAVVLGISSAHYGCHGGTINNLGISVEPIPFGGGRPSWASKLTTVEWDAVEGWYNKHLRPWLNTLSPSSLSQELLDSIFAKIVEASIYSIYTFGCVVNYGTESRPGQASCLTSLFVEYLLRKKIGTVILGPTMFNRQYVSRSYAQHPSMVRAAIWIPYPAQTVFKDDVATMGMSTIPTSSYPGRRWQEFLLPGNHYNDWNKHLKQLE